MNDYIAFLAPGRYSVQLTTSRLAGTDPLQSNAIELDILARDTAADEDRFNMAMGSLDAALRSNTSDAAGEVVAARILRCLQTESAARYLVSIYGRRQSTDEAIYLALRTSLFRERVLTDLEAHLADADFPVRAPYIDTMVELSSDLGRFGPGLAVASEQDALTAYYQTVLQSAPRKTGEARAVTYFTVFNSFFAFRSSPLPIGFSVAARRGLVDSLLQAPADVWRYVLGSGWNFIADPGTELIPALKSAYSRSDIAERVVPRLAEVDPDSAGRIVLKALLDNIPRLDGPWPSLDQAVPRLSIPFSQELENDLLGLYEHGYVGVEARLVRYASPRIAKSLLAAYDRNFERNASLSNPTNASQPYPICTSPLLLYFFRVDSKAAAQRVARIRQLHHYPDYQTFCGGLIFGGAVKGDFTGSDFLVGDFMSPGLERQLIEDLRSSDPMIQIAAASSLGAGSAVAKQPLWDALKLLANPPPDKSSVRDTLVRALLGGSGRLMPADYDLLERLCGTSPYCSEVKRDRQSLREPYRIRLQESPSTGFWILQHAVDSLAEIERQIALFPRGSSFQWMRSSALPIDLIPVELRRRDQVRALVLGHGMKWAPDYELPR